MTAVPFPWRTGTNPDGQHILICDRGGTPDSPQPNDTWTITLEPIDFKYDDQARETLAAMVDLWPAALSIIRRNGTRWLRYSDLERRVLDLLTPENTT